MKLVTEELPKIKIPDITSGDITASNINVTKMIPPTSKVDLQSPSTFVLNLNGATIGLTAKVKACQKILGKNVCASVNADMEGDNVNLKLTAQLVRSADKQRPTIANSVCVTTIGDLKLKTSGGVLGWVLDLFSSIIATVVKPDIEKDLSQQAVNVINQKLDSALAKMKIDIDLKDEYDIDYELTQDPVITSEYLEIDMKGQVTCPKKPMTSPYPSTPLVSTPLTNTKMVYALVSDKIVNDVLFIAHNLGQLAFTATKDTPEIGPLLELHCSTICLGSMIPDVDQLYPNSSWAVGASTTTVPPVITFRSDDSAQIVANLTTNVYAPDSSSPSSILKATFALTANVYAEVQNQTILGYMNISSIGLDVIESQIYPDMLQYLQDHLQDFIVPYVERIANKILGHGFKIPTFGKGKGQLVNTQVRLLDHTAQFETDFNYNL
jgi:hypothetical protein